MESLIYDLSGLKYKMAQDINEQLEGVGFVNLGVKARPDLVVLETYKNAGDTGRSRIPQFGHR